MSKKITVIKVCETCRKSFEVVGVTGQARQNRRFCSMSCIRRVAWNKGMKGIHFSPKSEFKKGHTPPHKGKKLRPQAIENIRIAHLQSKKGKGENHYNWKGGITSENHGIRTSVAYRMFRAEVLRRDKWTCVNCGYRSKGNGEKDIVVDHIKPFHLFKDLRLVVENGRSLCRPCDYRLGYNYHRDKNKTSSNVK